MDIMFSRYNCKGPMSRSLSIFFKLYHLFARRSRRLAREKYSLEVFPAESEQVKIGIDDPPIEPICMPWP